MLALLTDPLTAMSSAVCAVLASLRTKYNLREGHRTLELQDLLRLHCGLSESIRKV